MSLQPLPLSSAAKLTLVPPIHHAVDPAAYRSIFRSHAGGVAVVTADAGRGPVGFTATSVVSVSLSPPLVSFALSNESSSFPTLLEASTVVVNFLDADQVGLAGRFASPGVDRFAAPTRWSRLEDGSPVLDEAPSFLHGPIEHRFAVGDHHIIVAGLQVATQRRAYGPLIYHDGAYGTASPLR
jgi:flavin reductase (DIM6/NTAB) family NADH-FMN oxidoreductase RutF